jgi:hypothetical protein
MPEINLRELRDTRQLTAWLRSGKVVELYDRNRLLARMFLNQRMQHANDGPISLAGSRSFLEIAVCRVPIY